MSVLLWAVLAHGVVVRPLPQARVFEVVYDNGVPMAYAWVQVIGPGDSLYGEMEADSLGRVVFLPPGPGIWTLRISDGMGHGTVIRVTSQGIPESVTMIPPYQKAVCGVALVWGLAGTLFYILGRRRQRAYP